MFYQKGNFSKQFYAKKSALFYDYFMHLISNVIIVNKGEYQHCPRVSLTKILTKIIICHDISKPLIRCTACMMQCIEICIYHNDGRFMITFIFVNAKKLMCVLLF